MLEDLCGIRKDHTRVVNINNYKYFEPEPEYASAVKRLIAAHPAVIAAALAREKGTQSTLVLAILCSETPVVTAINQELVDIFQDHPAGFSRFEVLVSLPDRKATHDKFAEIGYEF